MPSLFNDKPDSIEINDLISKKNIFVIPHFQRAYKWKTTNLERLESDIVDIYDGEVKSGHFMGVVILHSVSSSPERNVFDVIDGQQRLTTIYLYLIAAAKVLAKYKHVPDAHEIITNHILCKTSYYQSNICIRHSKEDQPQMNYVLNHLTEIETLKLKLKSYNLEIGTEFNKKGRIVDNFKHAVNFMEAQFKSGKVKRVRRLVEIILSELIVVRLVIKDSLTGPKIFDSLNSRQFPMTIGELVRNDIFSKANSDEEDLDYVDKELWQPFFKGFKIAGKNYFDGFFFPYGLLSNPNLKKSEVYSALNRNWRKVHNAEAIIKDLRKYQNAYLSIMTGDNVIELPDTVALRISRLRKLNAPAAINPFLLQLLHAMKTKKLKISIGNKILDLIESFLVRRAICGHEPTGLHAIFKRLWKDCGKSVTVEKVAKKIRENKTQQWPKDDELKKKIFERSIYQSSIKTYILLEYDLDQKGEIQKHEETPWVEHVLPQTMTKNWLKNFTIEEHKKYSDNLPNLLIVTSKFNKKLSNKPYSIKKKEYTKNSMFKSTRQFGEKYEDWTMSEYKKRSDILFNWAKKRWPY